MNKKTTQQLEDLARQQEDLAIQQQKIAAEIRAIKEQNQHTPKHGEVYFNEKSGETLMCLKSGRVCVLSGTNDHASGIHNADYSLSNQNMERFIYLGRFNDVFVRKDLLPILWV